MRTTAQLCRPLSLVFFLVFSCTCVQLILCSHRGLLLVPSLTVTRQNVDLLNDAFMTALVFSHVSLRNSQMESQYQRSVPLEVRRAEGERVRAKHPDKIPVSSVWREEGTHAWRNAWWMMNVWTHFSLYTQSWVSMCIFNPRSLWRGQRGHELLTWTRRSTWCPQI